MDELWKFAGQRIPNLDEFLKDLIWKWLISSDGQVVVGGGGGGALGKEELKQGPVALTATYGKNLRIYATEENQWLKLTGMPKDGNPVSILR